ERFDKRGRCARDERSDTSSGEKVHLSWNRRVWNILRLSRIDGRDDKTVESWFGRRYHSPRRHDSLLSKMRRFQNERRSRTSGRTTAKGWNRMYRHYRRGLHYLCGA